VTRALLVLVLLSSAARAEDDKAKAVALFEEGQKEMKAGNFERACAALRESDQIHPDSGTRGSLARCYEKQGRVASAWKLWSDLSATAPERLRPDAEANAKKLEARVPKYVIRSSSKDFQATIDGEVVDATPDVPQPIDPGKHVFEANAANYAGWRHEFTAAEGKTEEIKVVFAPRPIVTPIQHVETPKRSSKRKYGAIMMGVGGAFVVGGTVLGVIARGRYDDAKDICGGDIDRCDPLRVEDARSKVDSARSAATLSTVSFVVGGVSLAAGVYLFLTAPKHRDGVAIAPAIGNDSAGVIVRGAF
jgi:hypothetical protein